MGLFSGKKKNIKHVNFNLEANRAFSDRCNDDEMDDETLTNLVDEEWWGEEDGAAFQARDKKLAELMFEKKLTPDQLEREYGESSRGMELQFRENANVIVTRKTNSYNAVRSLQQLYAKREKVKVDDTIKSIAKAYSLCCEGAVVDAARLAEADAKFVQDHVSNDSDVQKICNGLCGVTVRSRSMPADYRSSLKKETAAKTKKSRRFFSMRQ